MLRVKKNIIDITKAYQIKKLPRNKPRRNFKCLSERSECKQTDDYSYILKKLDAYTCLFLKNKVRRSQIFNKSRAKIIGCVINSYGFFNESVQ